MNLLTRQLRQTNMFEAGERAKGVFYDPKDDWQQEVETAAHPLLRAHVCHMCYPCLVPMRGRCCATT